jgi:VanZ family protein
MAQLKRYFLNMFPTNSFVRYWLPVILLCLAIFVQSSFPTPEKMPHWPNSDKLLHATVYGILAILFFRAFNSLENWHSRPARVFLISILAASLYGLSDEWHQSFVIGRTADAMDLLADFTGAVIGSGLYLTGLCLFRRIRHI